MRPDIVAGATFPDYELPDHRGKRRTLSELQQGDPLALVLSRGGFCPKERRQHEGVSARTGRSYPIPRASCSDETNDANFEKETLTMKSKRMLTIATAAVALVVLGGAAISAQDKYSLRVPGGLAFSEFRGYEDWAVVTVHRTEDLLKVVVANPVAMDAFRAGIPGNGKPFPDGSKMAKIEWRPAKSTTLPYDLPGAVYDVDFMVKDSKRFADGGGWGYAVFVHDVASKTYKPGTLAHQPPQGNDAKCGVACHTIVKGKDYVFTEYAKR